MTVAAPTSTGGLPLTGYEYTLDGGRTWTTRRVPLTYIHSIPEDDQAIIDLEHVAEACAVAVVQTQVDPNALHWCPSPAHATLRASRTARPGVPAAPRSEMDVAWKP